MKTTRAMALCLSYSLFASSAALAGDTVAEALSNPCAGCHGTNGESLGEAPVIAGLPEAYLNSTMLAYKNGTRYSTIMGRIAKGYTPEQIGLMAKHFAALPWQSTPQTTDAALVQKGEQIHKSSGCAGCHGATGVSPIPTTPRLAGQYVDYLMLQMGDYQDTGKPIPPTAGMMRTMLKGKTADDLEALAQFYASQQ